MYVADTNIVISTTSCGLQQPAIGWFIEYFSVWLPSQVCIQSNIAWNCIKPGVKSHQVAPQLRIKISIIALRTIASWRVARRQLATGRGVCHRALVQIREEQSRVNGMKMLRHNGTCSGLKWCDTYITRHKTMAIDQFQWLKSPAAQRYDQQRHFESSGDEISRTITTPTNRSAFHE